MDARAAIIKLKIGVEIAVDGAVKTALKWMTEFGTGGEENELVVITIISNEQHNVFIIYLCVISSLFFPK